MARQTFVVGETVWVYRRLSNWRDEWQAVTVTKPDVTTYGTHQVEVEEAASSGQIHRYAYDNTRRHILNDAEYQVLRASLVAKQAAAQAETERRLAAWETAMRSHAEYLGGLASEAEKGVTWGDLYDTAQQHLDRYFTLNSAGREWAKARTAGQEEAPK